MEVKEELMVVTNLGAYEEEIYYCGESEPEAFRNFKRVNGKKGKANIVRANVKKRLLKNVPFIMDFEVVEVLR